jgi:hypothetical protein
MVLCQEHGLHILRSFLHEQPPAWSLKGRRENASAIQRQRAFKVKRKDALEVLTSSRKPWGREVITGYEFQFEPEFPGTLEIPGSRF